MHCNYYIETGFLGCDVQRGEYICPWTSVSNIRIFDMRGQSMVVIYLQNYSYKGYTSN